MHYSITTPPWSQLIGPGFSKCSQFVGQLEDYGVGLFKISVHVDESGKLYQIYSLKTLSLREREIRI